MEKFFIVKNKGFNYNDKKAARYFFVVKSKKEIVLNGPMITQKENVKKFKKAHKKTFVKGKKVYAKEKVGFDLKQFIEGWKKKNSQRVKEMSIIGLKIV